MHLIHFRRHLYSRNNARLHQLIKQTKINMTCTITGSSHLVNITIFNLDSLWMAMSKY